jgi:REP element-mobilizing transposase RayT
MERSADIRPTLTLDAFVVMPNHVHGIVWLDSSTSDPGEGGPARAFGVSGNRSLSSFVRAFKAACTSRVNELRGTSGSPLWQRNYFEHVVRNERELHAIRKYIVENPQRWRIDVENPERQEVAPKL